MPGPVVGAARCVRLGHQHVAVGQHEEPARVIEAAGEGRDGVPSRPTALFRRANPPPGAMSMVGISACSGGGSGGASPTTGESTVGACVHAAAATRATTRTTDSRREAPAAAWQGIGR